MYMCGWVGVSAMGRAGAWVVFRLELGSDGRLDR